MTHLSTRLRALRKEQHMTQQQLADALGLAKSTISMYETGQREPDYATLEALAAALRAPIAGFFPSGEVPAQEPTFDDFTYAMHREARDLPPEKKEMLLAMARFMRQEQEKGG